MSANGAWSHGQLNQERREANDTRKRQPLTDAGIETSWFERTEMDDAPAFIEKFRAFVAPSAQERMPPAIDRDFPF